MSGRRSAERLPVCRQPSGSADRLPTVCGLGHHIMFGTLIVEDGVSAAGSSDAVPSFPEKAVQVSAGGKGGDR